MALHVKDLQRVLSSGLNWCYVGNALWQCCWQCSAARGCTYTQAGGLNAKKDEQSRATVQLLPGNFRVPQDVHHQPPSATPAHAHVHDPGTCTCTSPPPFFPQGPRCQRLCQHPWLQVKAVEPCMCFTSRHSRADASTQVNWVLMKRGTHTSTWEITWIRIHRACNEHLTTSCKR